MQADNATESSGLRGHRFTPILGLFAVALLFLCLSWVLPHHHDIDDDHECPICQLAATPSVIAQAPLNGQPIDRDLQYERPACGAAFVPATPAYLVRRLRAPPHA